MLSISTPLSTPEYVLSLSSALVGYYSHESPSEPPGRWFGDGAKALGLRGTVSPAALRNLFRGLSPDGVQQFVQNAKATDRQAGWDLTYSADKSISALWAVSPQEIRRVIEECHDSAVDEANRRLESMAGFTRRGRGSKVVERASLIWAVFQHATSRALDPQLHSHCLLINMSVRGDGTTGSILTKPIFRLKMIGGLIYRQELGRQLRERLGLELRQERTWFEISGVPQPLMDEFSKRRQDVIEYLKTKKRDDAIAAAWGARLTRPEKQQVPRAELFREWARLALEKFGFGPVQAAALTKAKARTLSAPSVAEAISDLLREQAYFRDTHLLRRILERAQATGIAAGTIIQSVKEALKGLVDLGVHDHHHLYTTHEVVRQERLLMEIAVSGRDRRDFRVSEETARHFGKALSPSQRDALKSITVDPGDIRVVQGLAGTGKSTLLFAANETWKAAGMRVLGAAYSGKAADGLAKASKIESHTVDRLLHQWAKELSAIKPLNRRSVLVVDEAGMLDTIKMARLVGIVKAAGAKLVLLGDEKQLPPVSAGAPFSEMGRRLGRSELREIRRQKNPLLRTVVEQLADGDPAEALRLLTEDKLLRIYATAEQAKDALVTDWLWAGSPKGSLMLAGTREDVRDLNRLAQAKLKRGLRLLLPMFPMNGETFHIGERVVFGRNNALLGVRNGSVGELTAYNPATAVATVRLDGEKSVFIPTSTYKHLNLGYCITTHKAQGATVDKAYVLWSDPMQSREMTYVQASRARLTTQFYLTPQQAGDDFAEALRDMRRSVSKDLAVSKLDRPEAGQSKEPSLSPSL